MINSLSISNFQSHKETELKLSPGVNVIVGPSDSGKTAILRALKWLIQNRPQGDAMRSNWGEPTLVEVETQDAFRIFRMRDESDNIYIMGKYDVSFGKLKEGLWEYQAIRSEVPEEIKQALNISPINIQQQLDVPFLLADSPGIVAQHFNKIAHLDSIDIGLQKVQRQIKEIEQTITGKEAHLQESQEALLEYDGLEELEGLIVAIEGKNRNQDALKANNQSLLILIQSIEIVDEQIKEAKKITKAEAPVNDVLLLMSKEEEKFEEAKTLSILICKIQEIDKLIIDTETKIIGLKDTFKKEFPDICPLCGQQVKL